MKYKNNLILWVIGITVFITGLLLYVDILSRFFEFEKLTIAQLGIGISVGFVSVIWVELLKWRNRFLIK